MSIITSGWLSQPIGGRVRLRRSTAILLVAFIGLGLLYLRVRTPAAGQEPSRIVVVTTTTVPREDEVRTSTTAVAPSPSTQPTSPSSVTGPPTSPPPPESTEPAPLTVPGESTTQPSTGPTNPPS